MKTLIYAAIATAAAFGVPALAAPEGANSRSMTVSYGDLDLSQPAGVNALYTRLRTAAGSVCGPKADGRNLTMRFYWKQCFNEALDTAVAKVAHVGLSEIHLAQTGRRVGAGQQVADTQ
jgi:UrcA family protein